MTNRPLNAIANGQIRVLVNHELGADGKGPGNNWHDHPFFFLKKI